MKKITVIALIFFILLGKIASGQDTTIQIDFTVYPLQFYNKWKLGPDIKYEDKTQIGPTLNIQFPFKEKWSLSLGLIFKSYFFKALYPDNTTSFDYILLESFSIRMPIYLNYRLYNNKKLFLYLSGGFDQPVWYFRYEEVAYYPYITDIDITYTKGFNIFSDFEDLPLDINLSLKYFPFKKFGFSITSYSSYNPFRGSHSFNCGIGLGVCYK